MAISLDFQSITLSNIFFGGIELVMIIIPAIIFIITISDFMHLLNRPLDKNKFNFFRDQILDIGKPVFITSLTTAIAFLSMIVSPIPHMVGYGIVIAFGVLWAWILSTTLLPSSTIFISLVIIIIVYAISIDRGYVNNIYHSKSIDYVIKITSIINHKSRIIILGILLSFTLLGILNIKIDNFLLDEVNKNSEIYHEVSYFDKYFGGVKPVSFAIDQDDNLDPSEIKEIEEYLKGNNFTIDFSSPYSVLNQVLIKARMRDIGSSKSQEIFNEIIKRIINSRFVYIVDVTGL